MIDGELFATVQLVQSAVLLDERDEMVIHLVVGVHLGLALLGQLLVVVDQFTRQ